MTDHAASLSVEVLPGEALPPGASWGGQGTNFSLFSDDRYEHQVALFLALKGVADQPDQRWPQANEQGPALGVAALVLVDRLGADPQRDAEPNGTE
jgi:hypothetical protein